MQKVDISSRIDLLKAFIKDPGLFFKPNKLSDFDFSKETYIKLLSRADVYEISGGVDFDIAARECLSIINNNHQ